MINLPGNLRQICLLLGIHTLFSEQNLNYTGKLGRIRQAFASCIFTDTDFFFRQISKACLAGPTKYESSYILQSCPTLTVSSVTLPCRCCKIPIFFADRIVSFPSLLFPCHIVDSVYRIFKKCFDFLVHRRSSTAIRHVRSRTVSAIRSNFLSLRRNIF